MAKGQILALGFLVVIVASVLIQTSPFSSFVENKFLDRQFRFLRAQFPRGISNDVVVVGIDEQTFETFREPLALWHPYLGDFFKAMAIAQPSVVGLDLVLPDRSYDFLIQGHDRKLLAGLLKLKPVAPIVLGQTVDERGKIRPLFAPLVSLLDSNALGLVLLRTDSDGTIRGFRSSVQFDNSQIPTLAPLMAKRLNLTVTDGLINYSYGTNIDYVPLQQVNSWFETNDIAQLKNIFNNRPVIIGSVLPFIDRHNSPVLLANWEPDANLVPGVLIHAQILRTLIASSTLQQVSVFFALSSLLVGTLLYWIGNRLKLGALLFGVFAITLITLSTLLLWQGQILSAMTPILVALLALLTRIGLESGFTFFENRRLNNSFGRYVSPNVMDEIRAGNISPDMVGLRRKVCVMFSDIRSFTTRSESEPPEAIIALLNRYFNEMTTVVHFHGGTVDKFIGDGLMVFFGAPNHQENAAQQAFDAAKEMLKRLDKLNQELETEGIKEIKIGVGIHFGEAVVGHVGSDNRHEYTVIGDTVNLAARLEGRTKELGYPIICSSAVADALDSSADLISLGETPIKGRASAKVFGWKPG